LGIGKKSGAKILAIKEDEKLITNPGGDFLLQPGQVLIAFGSKEQLTTLNRLLGNLVVSVELLK
jgi:voltage-gated potassium channel